MTRQSTLSAPLHNKLPERDHSATFNSSTGVFQFQRLVTNLALCVAFIISGLMYSDYQRVLGMGLGMATRTDYKVVTLLYSHVGDLLHEQIEDAKDDMKSIRNETIGSWARAVTCSDVVWQTCGHYSKNSWCFQVLCFRPFIQIK